MVDPELIDYVRGQVATGHRPEEIKLALAERGYPSEIVDNVVGQSTAKRNILSKKLVLILVGVFVIAGFVSLLYFTIFPLLQDMGEQPDGASEAMTSADCVDNEEYVQDFDTGWAYDWFLGDGFEIVEGESGDVLHVGTSSTSIATYLSGDYWTDVSFAFDVRLTSGTLRASVRSNFNTKDFAYDRVLGQAEDRYYVDLSSGSVVLGKTVAGIDETLDSTSLSFDPDQWYTVVIAARGDEISVSVDEVIALRATDSDIPSGSIDFATVANTDSYLDNIHVTAQIPCSSTWVETESSPYGGDINVITVDPLDSRVVFAGTEHAGLWRSADGGLTWDEVGYSGGVTRLGKTKAIAVAPSDTRIVYNAGKNEVDKSTDGGIHWTRTGLLDTQVLIQSIVVDPNNPDIVYAALGENVKAMPSQPSLGIFKSIDGGEAWEQLDFPRFTFSLAIPSTLPNVIYAGAFDGIYKSIDSGHEWTQVYALESDSVNGVSSVAVHPTDADTIYAASADGILKSSDGGATWSIIHETGSQILVSVADEEVLYVLSNGDIIRSVDAGATWDIVATPNRISTKPFSLVTIAVDSSNPDKIYAGTWGQGLFFSEDGGDAWREPAVWEVHADLGTAIVVDPSNDNRIYTGTSKGEVYVSDNLGDSWTLLVNLGSGQAYNSLITSIVVDPSNTQIVYASNLEGVFKSEDAGNTWVQMNNGLSDPRIISLALDPKNPELIFAGTGNSKPRNIFEGSGMFYSSNGGESWSHVEGLPDAPVPAIVISPADSHTIYATVMDVGVYKSEDGGKSWSQINAGLKNYCVYALAVDPEDPDVAYVGTLAGSAYCKTLSHTTGDDNVYKTENGGRSWEVTLAGENLLDTVEAIAIDPSNPNNVYVTYHTEKVWFSGDAGETWRRADDGVIRHGAHLYLWAVTFDSTGSHAYIATCGEGILKTDLKNAESPEALEERHSEH